MKSLLRKKNNNVFTTFLNYLDVKYTDEYANKLYNEHPHKYNLFGLSKMLSDYSIGNAGIKIPDKEKGITELEAPFIAHIGSDFVVIYKITPERVYYIWNQKNLDVPINEFCSMWSGVILYAEPDEESAEPDYKAHHKKEIFNYIQRIVLLAAIFLILILVFIRNDLYKEVVYYLLAAVNLIGVYVGYLLVLKQLHIHSEYADKLCSLFNQSDCNNVLESDAAKLGGVIGWSEIGLGYFITNVLIIVCFPSLIPYMVVINILALPYTFWSVWYQKFKAKQWCPLCLIVQGILWLVFFINLGFGFVQISEINITNILITGLLYLIPMLSVNILVPQVSQNNKIEQITQELNSIKSDEAVFSAMLKKQPSYEVDKNTSSILWGNKDSDILVTVLTNPHCNPCSKMHKRIEQVLSESNNLCVQYIFSSFSEDLDSSNKFLTAIYFTKEELDRTAIYRDWFEGGRNKKQEFFEKYDMVENELIISEFKKHQAWVDKTGLRATPTILVNGYKLPDNYKIEDLKYI